MKIRKPVNSILAMALLVGAGCSVSASGPYIAECSHGDFFEGYSDYSSCNTAIGAHVEDTGHKATCFQGIIV